METPAFLFPGECSSTCPVARLGVLWLCFSTALLVLDYPNCNKDRCSLISPPCINTPSRTRSSDKEYPFLEQSQYLFVPIIWPIFRISSNRHVSVEQQRNNFLNSSIVSCFLAKGCTAFSSRKGGRGNRRQLLAARHGWHHAHVSASPSFQILIHKGNSCRLYTCVLITLRCLVMKSFWWGSKESTRDNGMGRGWKAFAVAFEWDIVW